MIRQRIIQFIDLKGVSKYHFYKITGLSNGFLDKDGSIGSDKCEIILYHFPDLDPEWLLSGKGNMFRYQRIDNGPKEETNNNVLIEFLSKKNDELNREIALLMAENERLKAELGECCPTYQDKKKTHV